MLERNDWNKSIRVYDWNKSIRMNDWNKSVRVNDWNKSTMTPHWFTHLIETLLSMLEAQFSIQASLAPHPLMHYDDSSGSKTTFLITTIMTTTI